MNRRSISSIKGFIRLVDREDCIGIAVFGEPGMNHDLIAESDGDLTICRFVELYPEQGYRVDALPTGFDVKRRHSIGDPSPIPFVCDGKPMIIFGDRHPEDVDIIPVSTAEGSAVKSEVRTLLAKARDGFFREKIAQWGDESFQSSFPEVFEELPSNTRYWVSRYRLAITRSEKLDSKSAELTETLRRKGLQWLKLYGAKTDFGRLKSIFGDVADGVFGREDLALSAYGFLANKFANSEFNYMERLARTDPAFLGLLPEGLYYFDLRRTRINAPFKFLRAQDYLAEFKSRLYRSSDELTVPKLKGLALVLFGTTDVPAELVEPIQSARGRFAARFYQDAEEFKEIEQSVGFPYVDLDEISRERAERIVAGYEALLELEAAEFGSARLAPRLNDYLSSQKEYVDQLRVCLSGRWRTY